METINPFKLDLGQDYTSPDGRLEVHHTDGLPWFEAPLPPRRHTCSVQTWAFEDWVYRVERCACGAIRRNRDGWLERNSRRQSQKRRWRPF